MSRRYEGRSHGVRRARHDRFTRPLVALLAALALIGCGDPASGGRSSGDGGEIGLAMPDRLLQTRAVDRTTLRPVVSLSTGQRVPMRRVDDTLWSGTVRVDPDIAVDVDVLWVGDLAAGFLPLARLPTQRVQVGRDGAALAVSSDRYDYALDLDGDGQFNLAELEAGSDPFTGSDGVVVAAPELPAPIDTPEESPVNDEPAPPTVIVTPQGPVNRPDPVPEVTPDEDDEDDEEDEEDEEDERDDAVPSDAFDRPIDVYVPRISRGDKPDIDGEDVEIDASGRFVGEWADAVQVDSSGQRLTIDRLMIDLGAEATTGTPLRRWATMHDGRYLYVVVMVDDDGARFGDSELFWQDDGVELFIDGDHGRASSYGDDDDYHLIVPLLEPGTTASAKRPNANDVAGYQVGPNSSGRGIDLDFVTGPGEGPDGLRRSRFERDVYEFRIELDSIGVEPGDRFGFELQVNDDDDGGPRDSKWGWAHPARGSEDVDFTYLDPSYMGTLLLD